MTGKSKPVPSKNADAGVIKHPCGREVCEDNAAGRREYSLRTSLMASRQGWKCAISGVPFSAGNPAQFDHQAGRGSGGAHRDDRIDVNGVWLNAAVTGDANVRKASRRYEWRDGRYQEVYR